MKLAGAFNRSSEATIHSTKNDVLGSSTWNFKGRNGLKITVDQSVEPRAGVVTVKRITERGGRVVVRTSTGRFESGDRYTGPLSPNHALGRALGLPVPEQVDVTTEHFNNGSLKTMDIKLTERNPFIMAVQVVAVQDKRGRVALHGLPVPEQATWNQKPVANTEVLKRTVKALLASTPVRHHLAAMASDSRATVVLDVNPGVPGSDNPNDVITGATLAPGLVPGLVRKAKRRETIYAHEVYRRQPE